MAGKGHNTAELPLVHVYQNTEEGHVIFYTMKDKLFFYTLVAVLLRRHGLKAVAISLMPDHYHLLVYAWSGEELRPFVRDLNAIYAKGFNRSAGITGKMFREPVGFAVKNGVKERMSAINYVHNNPVVKKLDRSAASGTWNFLAYAKSPNPFSAKISRNRCRLALRKALGEVDVLERQGKWLSPPVLDRLFEPLAKEEKLQLFDYIASKYAAIDYGDAAAYFGSVEAMISAAEQNSGSEYELNEIFETRDDRPYLTMASVLLEDGICRKDPKEVLSRPYGERLDMFTVLKARSGATFRQMEKFLHLHEGSLFARKKTTRVSPYTRQEAGRRPKVIALTGFMGSGKSTVGRILAEKLGWAFADLDAAVEQAAGKSIPQIFAEDGEKAFRKLEVSTLGIILKAPGRFAAKGAGAAEAEASARVAARDGDAGKGAGESAAEASAQVAARDGDAGKGAGLVLALGGGTVMQPAARKSLEGRCRCIYLKATADTLAERLEGTEAAARPLLAGTATPPALRATSPRSGEELVQHRHGEEFSLRGRIETLLEEREAVYSAVAALTVSVDGLSPEDIASRIMAE